MPSNRRRYLAALGTALAAGCTAPSLTGENTQSPSGNAGSGSVDHTPPAGADWEAPSTSPTTASVSPTRLVENLEIPWDLSFAPNGDLFITERVGRVARFDGDAVRTVARPSDAIDAGSLQPGSDKRPWWVDGGEGGTLGVATHPAYPDPPFVYVYYTTKSGGKKHNKVVRYDAEADEPESTAEVIVDGIPANLYHNGGRLVFGPRNYLWVTTGDAGEPKKAQDPGTLNGKILRITPDGDPAPDNPGLDDPRVFSYGHRNPQGVTWTPDNVVLETEHGPSGHDEMNRLIAGDNYGWPVARTADAYRDNPQFHRPLLNSGSAPSWAPTGCVFYTGDAVPAWTNRLVVGTLVGQHINVVTLTPPDGQLPPLDGDSRRFQGDWFDDAYVATSHKLLKDVLGRVRLVTQGPDGALYAITSNRDGRANGKFPREVDDVLVRFDAE
ncbi:MAG: PQQ-dependent sugar dehydrogenase [Haloarculaceae archaeon]